MKADWPLDGYRYSWRMKDATDGKLTGESFVRVLFFFFFRRKERARERERKRAFLKNPLSLFSFLPPHVFSPFRTHSTPIKTTKQQRPPGASRTSGSGSPASTLPRRHQTPSSPRPSKSTARMLPIPISEGPGGRVSATSTTSRRCWRSETGTRRR